MRAVSVVNSFVKPCNDFVKYLDYSLENPVLKFIYQRKITRLGIYNARHICISRDQSRIEK